MRLDKIMEAYAISAEVDDEIEEESDDENQD